MKIYVFLVVLFIMRFLLLLEAFADIENVHIEVEGGQGGKGIAISRGLACFVITAAHVVGKDPLPILVIGGDRKTSAAERWWSEPEIDLAVIEVKNPVEICGRDSYIDIDYLEQRLEQSRFGVLRIRGEDGSEYDLTVRLTSWDRNYIYVEAQSVAQLGERLSGSALYIGKQSMGILIKVSTGQEKRINRLRMPGKNNATHRELVGYVYRIDRINEQVGEFLPLTLPAEEKARYDEQLAGDILRKHVNYMQTEDFCRNLWRMAKYVAKPEGGIYHYKTRRRGPLGGDEYLIKSMLFPGVYSVLNFKGSNGKHRTVDTRIGFVPESMQLDRIWKTAEQVIDKCINSRICKEIGRIRRRQGMHRDDLDKRTMWTVERTGFLGIAMETADIWLEFTSGAIELHVWAMD